MSKISSVSFDGKKIIKNSILGLFDSGNTLVAIPTMFKSDILGALRAKKVECKLIVEDNINFSQLHCYLD